MNESIKNTLILGLGNPILGDDRLGLQLVEDLQKRKTLKGRARFQCSVQAGLYLLDLLIGFERVIFIDTITQPSFEPGKVVCWQLQQTPFYISGSSPHYIGVNSMIAVGKRLKLNMPEEIWLIAVTIKSGIEISEHLSSAIQQQYPTIVREVEKQILRILQSDLQHKGLSHLMREVNQSNSERPLLKL